MAAQTTHLVSKTQACEFGAFLRELTWEMTRIPGPIPARGDGKARREHRATMTVVRRVTGTCKQRRVCPIARARARPWRHRSWLREPARAADVLLERRADHRGRGHPA